jgi:hypothetical protein
MEISKLSTESLKAALHLVQERESLEAKLAEVNAKLVALFEGRSIGSPSSKAAGKKTYSSTKKTAGRRSNLREEASRDTTQKTKDAKRARKLRGDLAGSILDLLKKAGPVGVTARQISAELGIKNQNIHVWFGGTGKKYPQIVKLGRGHWAYIENNASREAQEQPQEIAAEVEPTQKIATEVAEPQEIVTEVGPGQEIVSEAAPSEQNI